MNSRDESPGKIHTNRLTKLPEMQVLSIKTSDKVLCLFGVLFYICLLVGVHGLVFKAG